MRFALPASLRGTLAALALLGSVSCGGDSTGPTTSMAILDITNSTTSSVWYVRVRTCGATAWGSDLLGADIIPKDLGQSFEVAPGCRDVRLESSPNVNGEKIWLNQSFTAGQITALTVTDWTPMQ